MKLQLSLLQCRLDVFEAGFGLPRAAVPEHDDAGAVALGNDALKFAIVPRMVLNAHRQPLIRRVQARPFGHRPGKKHAFVFKPKIVMQMAGQVFLHAEEQLLRLARRFASAAALPFGSGVAVKLRFL